MPYSSRRALSAILLAIALAFAAPPVQARESLPAGWFDALTRQLTQWTAGWWTGPAGAAVDQAHARHATPARQRPPVDPDCGVLIDPGGCP